MNKKYGAFSSSEDPEQLASTVKGFILGIGVLIIWAVQYFFHIDWTVNNVNQLATSAAAIASSIWIAYGLVKKGAIWIINAWNNKA